MFAGAEFHSSSERGASRSCVALRLRLLFFVVFRLRFLSVACCCFQCFFLVRVSRSVSISFVALRLRVRARARVRVVFTFFRSRRLRMRACVRAFDLNGVLSEN